MVIHGGTILNEDVLSGRMLPNGCPGGDAGREVGGQMVERWEPAQELRYLGHSAKVAPPAGTR